MKTKKILDYRTLMMAIAMIMIVIFHSELPAIQYNFIYRNLHIGVDFFLFLSGLGIVQSLHKNDKILDFYKRRVLRIIPTILPLVVIFSYLLLLLEPSFTYKEFYLQITGFNFWLSKGHYPYTLWYIPCIMLYYFISPLIYKYLKNQKQDKYFWFRIILYFIIIYLIPSATANVMIRNIFSRFPIYVLGMIYGFRVLKNEAISKKEFISLLCLLPIMVYLIHIIENNYSIYTNHFVFALYIPIILLTTYLITYLGDRYKLKSRVFDLIGTSTLAIYGSQEFIKLLTISLLTINKVSYNIYLLSLIIAIISITFGIIWTKFINYINKNH